ncbi:hypothetical protein GCM10010428_50210 [Actinosynnema pretiosum subsp. pretiosum]
MKQSGIVHAPQAGCAGLVLLGARDPDTGVVQPPHALRAVVEDDVRVAIRVVPGMRGESAVEDRERGAGEIRRVVGQARFGLGFEHGDPRVRRDGQCDEL